MHSLQVQYANYLLGFEWDAYYTQTFRNRRNDGCNAVTACWYYLQGRLSWTRAFVAVENHRLGGVHLHALLSDDLRDWSSVAEGNRSQSLQLKATKRYMDKAFGFSHVTTARNQATVSLYCAKYVTKTDGDYYFLGHW